MNALVLRSIAVWLLLLVAAVGNGGSRQAVLIPRFGEDIAHIASTLLLCGLIILIAWLTLPWIGVTSERQACGIGGIWLLLTIGFEFLAGHFLFGAPWSTLLADYDLSRGRIWILVLVVTALTPVVVFRRQR